MNQTILKSDVYQIQLEPLTQAHFAVLTQVCEEDNLSQDVFNSVPYPSQLQVYINTALEQQKQGSRLAYVVTDLNTGEVIGTTSFHDIQAQIPRYEIGYTWYAKRFQRSYVNRVCKYLLLNHAFEQFQARVVGFRTDHLNRISQKAIENLGAKHDGVLRSHMLRKDGTLRDTYVYSILDTEWPELKKQLEQKILKYSDRAEFEI